MSLAQRFPILKNSPQHTLTTAFRSHNVIVPVGIGPLTLRDGIILESPTLFRVAFPFWFTVWCLPAITSGAILVVWAGNTWKGGAWRQPVFRMAAAFIVLYSVPFVFTDFIDCYTLPILLFVAAPLATVSSDQKDRKASFMSWTWLAVWVIVAAIAVHDYQAWQHAKWRTAEDLLAQGVDPRQVDGRFEFNSYYLYGRVNPSPEKSWWSVVDDECMVTFSKEPFPAYEPVSVYWVPGLLPTTPKDVFILHRKESN